jgi:deazaflavin-dependent oxidoreductase (nitroreductase family)
MPRSERELSLAAALALVSGGFMTWAGYVLATGSLALALWITLPAWLAIEGAFTLIRRADRAAGSPAPSRAARGREEALSLLAGGLMMLAGYAGAAWSWLLAVPFVGIGGVTISAAGLTRHHPGTKRGLVRAVEKYAVNPPTKAFLRLGVPMPLVLLETTGRRTGKARRTPVMNGVIGDELWIVAEHGYRADYVRNLIVNPRIRVKSGRRWREGRAEVLHDDQPLARTAWIAEKLGRSPKMELLATRALCVDPVTVRIDLSDATAIAAAQTESAGSRLEADTR